ncbi:hypothetical protein BH23ACT9_BH23ACT9_11970 [soil metagenome]
MSPPITDQSRLLSYAAITLGALAVVLVVASFAMASPTGVRMVALVLMLLGLGIGRMARRPPPDRG